MEMILRMILKRYPSHVADKQDYSTTPPSLAPTFDFYPEHIEKWWSINKF